jgi:hypothetical protein
MHSGASWGFRQRRCWRLKGAEIWRWFVMRIVPHVPKDRAFETSGTTTRHIPEYVNLTVMLQILLLVVRWHPRLHSQCLNRLIAIRRRGIHTRTVRPAEHGSTVDITVFILRYFPYLPLPPSARKWKNNLKFRIIRDEIWWHSEVVCMYNVALKKVMYIVLCTWCEMYHNSFLPIDQFCLRRHVMCIVDSRLNYEKSAENQSETK